MLLELTLAAAGLHGPSFHVKPGYETATFGAYVEARNGLTAGVVRNSEGDLGGYIGVTQHIEHGPWQYSVTTGVIFGYKRTPVSPLVVGSVKHREYPYRVAVLPPPPGGSAALHLIYENRF